MSGDREKLVELLRQCVTQNITLDPDCWDAIIDVDYGKMADSLLGNCVVALPCKVGQEVYHIFCGKIRKLFVAQITIGPYEDIGFSIACYGGVVFDKRHIGKTVFLTREDAEAALKEGQ